MDAIYWFSVGALGGITLAAIELHHRHQRRIAALTHEIACLKNEVAFGKGYHGSQVGRLMAENTRLREMYLQAHTDLHAAKAGRLEAWKEAGQ